MAGELIDILTPLYANCPTFTVNTGGPLSVATTPTNILYRNSALYYKFQNGDNIILLSAGFVLPENFVLADTNKGGTSVAANEMQLYVYKQSSLVPPPVGLLPGLGDRGVLVIPMESYEVNANIFCDMSTLLAALAGEDFVIQGNLYVNNISMLNVPVALNATTQHIIPFIKVLHNLPMIV
jgi:hypothetical protein